MDINLSIIVAVAQNNAIGKGNDLLCYLPGDLKRFKEITSGNAVVMGRKTFDSLPKGPLPNRKNIVISRSENLLIEGAVVVDSIEKALKECSPDKENFIIGGGVIYKHMLPYVNKLYLTKIHHEFDADVFFPELQMEEWKLIEREDISASENNPYNFSYETYVRK